MADESKPPQSPDSPKPDSTGAASTPPAAPKSPIAPASPATPKPAAPPAPKPPVVLQVPLDNDLTRRYRERFGSSILDALEDRKQPYLISMLRTY